MRAAPTTSKATMPSTMLTATPSSAPMRMAGTRGGQSADAYGAPPIRRHLARRDLGRAQAGLLVDRKGEVAGPGQRRRRPARSRFAVPRPDRTAGRERDRLAPPRFPPP